MSTEATNPGTTAPEGNVQTSSSNSSAPVMAPAKVNPFAGTPPPTWVKEAGLMDAHKKSEEAANVTAPTGTTKTEGVAPAVSATATPPAGTQSTVSTTAAPSTVAPAASAPAPFDPISFAKTMAQALREANKTDASPAETEADLRKRLNVFEANDADYEELLGVRPDSPARVAKLNAVLQNIARQSVTMNQILMQQALREQMDSLTPYLDSLRSQEASRQKELFFTENPALKGYDAIVQKEFQLALASGKKFPDKDAARKYVADMAVQTLKAAGISPTAQGRPSSTSTTTTIPNTSTRKMTTTAVGGHSGTSATTQPTSTVQAVWGRKR